jgi:putative transposase
VSASRSGYYAARHRGPTDCQKRRVDLTARIRTIHQASRKSYGAPRVRVELMAQEVPCCRNTVAKLMHKAAILPKTIRRFLTTDSRKTKGKVGSNWPRFGRVLESLGRLRNEPNAGMASGRA